MTINGLRMFAGIALSRSVNASTSSATIWLTPDFQDDSERLLLPPLSELAGQSSLQAFIWGNFKVFGPQVELTSSEGLGTVSFQRSIGGWPLTIASDAWWILMLICGGLGILFLRRFTERQKRC